jgi:glucose-6-phosphate isomerase
MSESQSALITYDPRNVHLPDYGLTSGELGAIAGQVEAARSAALADLELLRAGRATESDRQPLDAGFIDLPDRLLLDYEVNPETSEVGKLLRVADQLAADIDTLVVVGIGGSYMGTRSLFEACCHPHYNELTRDERGQRPRLYFAGYNVDNDTTQGLLDLLRKSRFDADPRSRWGIIVVSKSGSTLEPAIAYRQLFTLLRDVSPDWARRLVVPITGPDSRLHRLAQKTLETDTFFIPDDVGGRFSIFTACGLLPAAAIGIDVVKLLQGARAMNQRFRSGPLGSNPVLDYTGVCHLLEQHRGLHSRVLSLWKQGLEAVGLWYDQLLSESLGKAELGATPITVVNTRDLHSRGQQHQEGRRDKLITNLIVREGRRDPLTVGHSEHNEDQLNEIGDKTLPEVMNAANAGTTRAYRDGARPTADIVLPDAGAYSLGQLYQMFMLATAVEGYLLGINPYGQPGVEAYKKHMKSALGE